MNVVSPGSWVRSSGQLSAAQETHTSPAFEARLHASLATAEATWRILEREGRCTAFQRYDWVSTVIRHLSEPRGDEVLVVELADAVTGQPVMLLPLIRRRRPGYRVIDWLNCGVCDYSAPVLAAGPAWCASDAAAAWAAARAVLPSADLLRVDFMPADISGAANPLIMLAQTRLSAHTTCGVPIDGDPDTVLERCCRPSFVRRLGKARRRLERRGTVHFVEARTEAEVDAIFSVLLEQRLARFRKLGRFDLLRQPAIAAFYRDAAMQGLRGGPVRLLGLRVGDEWVGTYYGVAHGGAYQGLLITIAGDAWRNYSLGLQVHAHVVKWACGQGLDYFDMSVGELSYKSEIGGHRWPLFAIDEALTLRGRLILLGLRAGAAAKAWLLAKPWVFERLRNGRRWLRRLPAHLKALLPHATRQ